MTTKTMCPGGRELCPWALRGLERLTCREHPNVNAASPFESHHADDGSRCECQPENWNEAIQEMTAPGGVWRIPDSIGFSRKP